MHTIILLLLLPTFIYARKSAVAIIRADTGIWGSMIFHQWSPTSPLVISTLFNNVKISSHPIHFVLANEPVHYDLYPASKRCTQKALRYTFNPTHTNPALGEISRRHKNPISASRYANVMYDPLLTLHPGANSILNRTLVIRQGDASEDVCATVEGTDMHSLRPGLIPCVMKQYADCLVGTEKQDVCVYRACMGWERVWGKVEDGVLLCTQVFERFPKVLGRGGKGGKVKCRHGVYGLLKHSDAHARTL